MNLIKRENFSFYVKLALRYINIKLSFITIKMEGAKPTYEQLLEHGKTVISSLKELDANPGW